MAETQTPPQLPKMQDARYRPAVDDLITVMLPGERTRARIIALSGATMAVAQIVTFTTSREHHYKKDDHIACRYVIDGFNQTTWEAIDERELDRSTQAYEKSLEEKVKAIEPEPEPVSDAPQINVTRAESDFQRGSHDAA